MCKIMLNIIIYSISGQKNVHVYNFFEIFLKYVSQIRIDRKNYLDKLNNFLQFMFINTKLNFLDYYKRQRL